MSSTSVGLLFAKPFLYSGKFEARVFVSISHYHSSLIFVSKARNPATMVFSQLVPSMVARLKPFGMIR